MPDCYAATPSSEAEPLGPASPMPHVPGIALRDAVEALLDLAGDDAPVATRRARAAIAQALAPLYRSPWSECADRCSRLTAGGFPFQIFWCPDTDGVRWAADAAGPECPPPERLMQALRTLDALHASLDAGIAHSLIHLQRGRALHFGAWLGGRHDAAGDACTLYAEWPARARRWVDVAAAVHAPFAALDACRGHAAPRALEFDTGGGDAAIWLRPRAPGHDGLWPIALALDAETEFAALIGAARHLMRTRRHDAHTRWLVRVAFDDYGIATHFSLAGDAQAVAGSQHALRCAAQAYDDHGRLAREWLAWGLVDGATVALGLPRGDTDVRLLAGIVPTRGTRSD